MRKSEATQSEISAWFTHRLPEEWVAGPTQVSVDREEITVILTLAGPSGVPADDGPDGPETTAPNQDPATEAERAEALAGYLARWRSDTRERRIGIAREAEHRFGRKVAWGVRVGEQTRLFTHLAVPVMTRLRQGERQVLDTLVEAGVARSRADALAWCVRLVGRNTETWLSDLRTAMETVAQVRESGPPS